MPEPEIGSRPWRPPSLGQVELGSLAYLVVDEIVGSSVGLVLADWPSIDSEGRLRFAVAKATLMLGAERGALEHFLAGHRLPPTLAKRPLRIGDVFGVSPIAAALAPVREELVAERRLEPLLSPEEWIAPPIYDLTAEAREAAKLTFYAAVAPTLSEDEADELRELTD
jgi:hypothetical protein